MPKTMCPLCGTKGHVNTGSPERYERKHPELFVVGYACRLCLYCAAEIDEGDRVQVRDTSNAGVVERVANCGNGFKLYRIQLDSGLSSTLPRFKVIKLPA